MQTGEMCDNSNWKMPIFNADSRNELRRTKTTHTRSLSLSLTQLVEYTYKKKIFFSAVPTLLLSSSRRWNFLQFNQNKMRFMLFSNWSQYYTKHNPQKLWCELLFFLSVFDSIFLFLIGRWIRVDEQKKKVYTKISILKSFFFLLLVYYICIKQ